MINTIVSEVLNELRRTMDSSQLRQVSLALFIVLNGYSICRSTSKTLGTSNIETIDSFISAKKLEGCSAKTLSYYQSTIAHAVDMIDKPIVLIDTDDLRRYLSEYQQSRSCGKVTMDNIRRILSSFFAWLEDEDVIVKSPVRRIRKVKIGRTVKDTFSDEELERLRDAAGNFRDLAMVDILSSTGMRVGELVKLNVEDVDFANRECKVLGKGDSERIVYFDARTKLHLKAYLESRTDDNEALFVNLNRPHFRTTINCIESRLKAIGRSIGIGDVHPHKFRRTMATQAIDKGMPIEQVQKLLGHMRIDTTMHYAMVNQSNVKMSHRKFIS